MKLNVLYFIPFLDEVFSEALHAQSVECEFNFVKLKLGEKQITFNDKPYIYFSL